MKNVTIDFIDQVVSDELNFKSQIEMLGHLRAGLEELYIKCKTVENKIQNNNSRFVQAQTFSLLIYTSKEFYEALPSYFHWFSVSTINYVRLVGYLKGIQNGHIKIEDSPLDKMKRQNIKEICNNYVKSIKVLGPVEAYRNKVAAHFAITDPRSDDNFVTMNFSAINKTGLSDSKLVSKAEINLVQNSNGDLIAEDISIWSITKVFEELSPRFWPDLKIPIAQSGESFFEKNEREKSESEYRHNNP
jgi:hypothetical protein